MISKNTVTWNLINSLLAGALVMAGALSDGMLSSTEVLTSFGAAVIVAITKFREYWLSINGKKGETNRLFEFL